MYGGITISSTNHTAISVPSAKTKNHKKTQNVSETLKKLKNMQMANLTISKTTVPTVKPVRKCKIKRKFYGDSEDESDNELDFDGADDEDNDPDFAGNVSDGSESIEIEDDDDDDKDYEPSSKMRRTTRKPNDSPVKSTDSNTKDNDSSTNSKFKAIKINAPPVFLCMKCKNRFDSLNELKQHVFQKNSCSISQQTCKICDKVFENRRRMVSHMKVHEEKAKYICDKCGKMYTNQFNLENHKSAQHGEYLEEYQNVYKCRLCSEKFNNRTDLYSHMKTHTKENQQLLCDTCGKCFTNSNNLKSHMRIHQDIRPHACELCPKRFRTRLLLRQHLHVHTGIKEFECSVCSQTFAKQDSLRIHLRKRHPEFKASNAIRKDKESFTVPVTVNTETDERNQNTEVQSL